VGRKNSSKGKVSGKRDCQGNGPLDSKEGRRRALQITEIDKEKGREGTSLEKVLKVGYQEAGFQKEFWEGNCVRQGNGLWRPGITEHPPILKG